MSLQIQCGALPLLFKTVLFLVNHGSSRSGIKPVPFSDFRAGLCGGYLAYLWKLIYFHERGRKPSEAFRTELFLPLKDISFTLGLDAAWMFPRRDGRSTDDITTALLVEGRLWHSPYASSHHTPVMASFHREQQFNCEIRSARNSLSQISVGHSPRAFKYPGENRTRCTKQENRQLKDCAQLFSPARFPYAFAITFECGCNVGEEDASRRQVSLQCCCS